MTPETDQNASTAVEGSAAGDKKAATKAGAKPRAGVPTWRTGKPDAFLAAAVDVARTAVEGIAPAEQIGRHLAAKSEGDRLVTHLFESKLPGYGGWQWYAVLTRNSRSKVVTVDELGLLPSEDSILAPEWIPWAERVRPGDEQGEDDPGEQSAAPLEDADGPTSDADTQEVDAGDAPADNSDNSNDDAGDSAVDGTGDTPDGEFTASEAD